MDTFTQHCDKLNDDQKKAVDTLEGPVLVLAGPGTGKTQLLSVRAANIIRSGKAGPANILILTFTNAAAGEMRRRLADIVGQKGYEVVVETFHSFANSVVLESEWAIKHIKDKVDISDVERVAAMEYILDNVKGAAALRPFGNPYVHRSEIERRIGELKREGISADSFKKEVKLLEAKGDLFEEKYTPRLKALSVVYENYERLKGDDSSVLFDERGRKDYDDMIFVALKALKEEKDLREAMRREYKYVMVDEFQDTNGAQLEILFQIMDPESPNICCVGDDDQSIYRFQGATLSNFRLLREKFVSLDVITLTDNYRSTDQVLDTAGDIISQLPAKERMAVKKLEARSASRGPGCVKYVEFTTEEEELSYIASRVKEIAGSIGKDASLTEEERNDPYGSIAVLVRRREQILRVVDAFLKAGIPYATDGKEDISGEKRVKQMLDVLLLASSTAGLDEKSLALYRILTADYIGAELSDVMKIVQAVNEEKAKARKSGLARSGINLFGYFSERFFGDGSSGPSPLSRAARAIERLLRDADTRPVHDLLMTYIDDVRLYSFLLSRYEKDKVIRMRDLRSLVNFINVIKESGLSKPSMRLDDLMNELALRETHDMPITGRPATMSQEGVRVYTAHSSKGLEFHTVFMPFCLQGDSWPSRKKNKIIPLPPDIYKSAERVPEKERLKELDNYDEIRLFYVASTRAKANLIYTATPEEKTVASPYLSHVGVSPDEGKVTDEEKFLAGYLKREGKDEFTSSEISAILKGMVRELTLNPTSLNNYMTCKRKFLYDNVLMLPGKRNQSLTFGNCAHKALEEVYRRFMETKSFPPFSFFRKEFLKELDYQGVNRSIKRGCVGALDDLEKWYKKTSAKPVIPLDLENKLEITLPGGVRFSGKFDKVEQESGGKIRIIDYKTGKVDEHVKAIAKCRDLSRYECDDYYRQLVAYKMLYERAGWPGKKNFKVAKGVIQFLRPVADTVKKYNLVAGEYRDEAVELDDAAVEELERLIVKVWEGIQSLDFEKLPERDEDRCRNCEFDSICWEK